MCVRNLLCGATLLMQSQKCTAVTCDAREARHALLLQMRFKSITADCSLCMPTC